jgi:biotin transporter BioY
MGFGFLTGFLPAFPVAVLVAGKMRERFRPLCEILWTLLAFSVYFWVGSLFILWKSQV